MIGDLEAALLLLSPEEQQAYLRRLSLVVQRACDPRPPSAPPIRVSALIETLRSQFHARLSAKPGRDKNEVMAEFEKAVSDTLAAVVGELER